MKNKLTARYVHQLALDQRGWQEHDGGDHRPDILLHAARLPDKSYLTFLQKEFGISDTDLAAMLRSAEPGQP